MAIQWFPGHMHATRKAMAERMRDIDVVIELLDARLPASSASPLLAELTGARPRLKLLNKQDLADPARTADWLAHYNGAGETRAVGFDASQGIPAQRRLIVEACHTLAPLRGGMAKPMRVLICGVPNVGKSTLVNGLLGVKKAKTGDEAGITKMEQRVTLADDFYLWDTPGMLWPRITTPESGTRLAASGAIGRNAYDDDSVALDLLAYLKRDYPVPLAARFKLKEDADTIAQLPEEALLEAIGRQRGALLGKGRTDLQKAAEIVVTEFRAGLLGRITLETVDEYAMWLARAEEAEALRQAKKAARKSKSR